MSDLSQIAIETAIKNLSARQPKPRGRREILSPYVPQLRALLAAGWSRAEIVAEIKACGAQMSPALLRDVLQIDPNKPQRTAKPKSMKRRDHPKAFASVSSSVASPPISEVSYDRQDPKVPEATSSYGAQSAQDIGRE